MQWGGRTVAVRACRRAQLQRAGDLLPFLLEGRGRRVLAGALVPAGGIRLVAFDPVQIGMRPGPFASGKSWQQRCAWCQSPLACHHKACAAPLIPAGGAAPLSDDLNCSNCISCSSIDFASRRKPGPARPLLVPLTVDPGFRRDA